MASVHKRTWTYNGREKSAWVVRFSALGQHKQKTFSRKKEAEEFAATRVLDRGSETKYVDPDLKVLSVCEEFLRYSEDKLRDGRISWARMRSLTTMVNFAVKPHIGSMKLADITSVTIEDWYRTMCRTAPYNGARGATIKPMTARTRIRDFKLVQDFAVKRGWMKGNPVDEALKDLRGLTYDKVRTFSSDEVRTLLSVARVRRARSRTRPHQMLNCYLLLSAYCGLRYGEIAGLKRSNLDFDRSVIMVRHSVNYKGELKGPKTRSGIRDIPMTSPVAKALKDWIGEHYRPEHGEFVFRTATGKVMQNPSFHKTLFKPLLAAAGLSEDFHFHALRHFCASYLIDNGMSVMDVARILGHSSFDMTLQVYAHPVDSGSRRLESMERIAGLLTHRPHIPASTSLS